MKYLLLILAPILFSFTVYANNNMFSITELIIQTLENPPESCANSQLNCIVDGVINYGNNLSAQVVSIKLTGNKRLANTYLLSFAEPEDILAMVEYLNSTACLNYVEPNYIGHVGGQQNTASTIPDDEYFFRQYSFVNDGSFPLSNATVDADIDMDEAWDVSTGNSNIIIAVLDAGTKFDHPEFAGRIWSNSNENNTGTDTDNNGYIDDITGWDFANDDNDATDDHGHGTNVAGIIGSNADNGIGYAGVDWNCQLMNIKILDEDGSGLYTWWAEGIYYAVDNGADILNMSVGGSSFSQTLEDAVNYAHANGVTVVACMMNFDNDTPYYPAAYDNTIAVGATNPDDTRAAPFFWSATSGSNYGAHIDLVAPGNYMYSLNYLSNTVYSSYWGGTSQATPLVAGVCGLLLDQDPTRTPEDLRSIVTSTAEDLVGNSNEDVAGFDQYFGHGRLNAHVALAGGSVDINSINYESDVRLYPNPANDVLYIESTMLKGSYTFNNLLGEVICTHQFQESNGVEKIDLNNIPTGIYVISTIDAKNNTIFTQKLMVE